MPEEADLTMCWFGTFQPYATSVVHVPEQEISPKEVDTDDLIFIWDKYMKADFLTNLLKIPVPWSPALLEGYSREWFKDEKGKYTPKLVKDDSGKCLGAVLLLSRLEEGQLKPLIESYQSMGYRKKTAKVLVGDLTREIDAFLP